MAGTIKEIAEIAGVSRGTVDRALNDRGRINPEVAKHIKEIAKEMGYQPKHKNKELRKRKELVIGVVTQLAKSSFMEEINRGIQDACLQLRERGIQVLIKEGNSVDEREQLEVVKELEGEGISGLAIMPVECEGIRNKINTLIEQDKIPVVTFNSDIIGTKRGCFVGMDNKKSGQTAAGLMNIMLEGKGKILIITGFFSNNLSNARVEGFVGEVKKSFPNLEVIGVQGSFDEAKEVEKIIVNTMMSYTALDGIYVASAGQGGIEVAFNTLGIKHRPKVIIHDLTPENILALEKGVADFIIDQEGYQQGYQALITLADELQFRKPPTSEFIYTDINIKTKYNL